MWPVYEAKMPFIGDSLSKRTWKTSIKGAQIAMQCSCCCCLHHELSPVHNFYGKSPNQVKSPPSSIPAAFLAIHSDKVVIFPPFSWKKCIGNLPFAVVMKIMIIDDDASLLFILGRFINFGLITLRQVAIFMYLAKWHRDLRFYLVTDHGTFWCKNLKLIYVSW